MRTARHQVLCRRAYYPTTQPRCNVQRSGAERDIRLLEMARLCVVRERPLWVLVDFDGWLEVRGRSDDMLRMMLPQLQQPWVLEHSTGVVNCTTPASESSIYPSLIKL